MRTKGCDWSIKLIYKDRDSSIVRRKKTYFGVGQCYNVRQQLTRGLAVKLKRENVNINNMNCSVPSKYQQHELQCTQ